MATIHDVARLAGISRTTVSRVLNCHPYVAEEKKQKILNAMKQLNYVPNSSAQRLRKVKTDTIAVFVPRITNPFFSHLVEVMENEAAMYGYQLILCQTQYSKKQEVKFLELLRTKQVDGVILTSIENEWRHVQPYVNEGPIVICNEYDDEAHVPSIFLNQVEGGYLGTKHLIERGYKKIAYCAGSERRSRLTRDRRKGYELAMKETGLDINEDWYQYNAISIEDGKKVFHRIKALKNRPEAIFTGSDEVAAGLLKAARDSGWRVPEDLAIVGFDNQPLAELLGLSTVKQPIEDMARHTMQEMIRAIQGKDHKKVTNLSFTLIHRTTT
ncbi:LacI family transcriptional regulator [Fictibacillus phosphorivorans]|uniref:LacI family transcriptional regulator n=1 Tax=Fictibacillus phosphorivorans TaxID=1221500 RepID=A0A160IMI0_9BACL|nr:LacI family DNA-binding transcriptional regulator [Fictibacillus phosphorivorans]ANC77411.1 LacI family transcriptional regulator [Fictibacillus phosphorivorans]